MSKKTCVEFNEAQRSAFQRLRNILASEDVILKYPDFQKLFDLTTDASASGIGAVLSQEGRPITMISRTLRQAEQNYATNERELLAIVWVNYKIFCTALGKSTYSPTTSLSRSPLPTKTRTLRLRDGNPI